MAVWTDILLSVFNTGQPTNGVNVKQISENIKALAEGAAGAPDIQIGALEQTAQDAINSVSAITALPLGGASTFFQKRVCQLVNVPAGTTVAGFKPFFSPSDIIPETTTILKTGTIRIRYTTTGNVSVRAAANDTSLRIDQVNNTTFEYDLLVAAGTVLRFEGGSATIFDLTISIYTSNQCSLVCA